VPKWIVTGGAGFIGANVAKALGERNVEVVAVDNLSRPSAPLNVEWLQSEVGSGLTLVRGDVRRADELDEIFARHRDAQAVLHLAGQVTVTTSVADPRDDFEANALGSFNVLEATRRHLPDAVFLNAATNKVYGQLEDHRLEERETRYVDLDFPNGVPESIPLDPHSPYGCSKAAADVYTLDYARIYGLRTVSFRQSCIYGPRQFGIEDQGWVAWFAIAARLGLPITIYGKGKQVRDLLHVGDLVDLYLRAAEHADVCAGRAYNVGGGPENTLSLLELLDRLGGPEVTFAAPRPGDQAVFVADVSRARADLGWEPRTRVDDGLVELLDWVERNAAEAAGLLQPA
jgi:CDP-paratose 2-epimerase